MTTPELVIVVVNRASIMNAKGYKWVRNLLINY